VLLPKDRRGSPTAPSFSRRLNAGMVPSRDVSVSGTPSPRRYSVFAVYSGGMGVVYGVVDRQTGLPRALKGLQEEFVTNERMRKLFAEEAVVWVRLEKHPHIVRAFSVEKIDEQPYLVTEFVSGPGWDGQRSRLLVGPSSPHGADGLPFCPPHRPGNAARCRKDSGPGAPRPQAW